MAKQRRLLKIAKDEKMHRLINKIKNSRQKKADATKDEKKATTEAIARLRELKYESYRAYGIEVVVSNVDQLAVHKIQEEDEDDEKGEGE